MRALSFSNEGVESVHGKVFRSCSFSLPLLLARFPKHFPKKKSVMTSAIVRYVNMTRPSTRLWRTKRIYSITYLVKDLFVRGYTCLGFKILIHKWGSIK